MYIRTHTYLGFASKRDTISESQHKKRIAIQWGLYLGSPVHGNYHFPKQSRSSIVDVEAPKVPMSEPPV